MTLPILYKSDSSGNIRIWKIQVIGNIIKIEHGQIDGKIQITEDSIKEGKNIGKVNSTTPETQALSEAQSKWEKQKNKKGYVEDIDRAKAKENDLKNEECMLAHTYGTLENEIFVPEQNHKIEFPAAVQPKFDGHRGIVKPDHTLWSRGHKPITQVPHIIKEINDLFKDSYALKLDGEFYNHELKEDFEKLSSIMRQQKQVHPNHNLVEYHVYDINIPELTFIERHNILKKLLTNTKFIKQVETRIVNSHEEIIKAYEEFIEMGYEGLMIRNLNSMYEGKRSYGLQKLKGFKDQEFKILGVNEGKGKLQKHAATFTCITDEGKTFEVKMEGKISKLKEYWNDHSLWEGKYLTVRFQGWTKKGIPRSLTGLRIREDI